MTPKQAQAIAALLSHPTIIEAAASVDVGERTLRTWMGQPAFRAALRDMRGRLFESVACELVAAAKEAVACLRRNLDSENPIAEVMAAKAIMDYTLKSHEALDLDARIAKLEGADGAGGAP